MIKLVKMIAIIYSLIFGYNSFAADKALFVRGSSIWEYDIVSNKSQLLIQNADNPSCRLKGDDVAFTRNNNIWLFSLRDQKEKMISNFNKKDSNEVLNLSWSSYYNNIAFERYGHYTIGSIEPLNPVFWPEGEYEKKSIELELPSIWILDMQGSAKKFIGFAGYGSASIGVQLGEVESPSWSPDGKILAFIRNGDIWMAKTNGLDDKIEQRIAPVADLYNENGASPSSIVCNFISWSPDGKMLVYNISRQQGSGYAELWIMDTQSRKAKKIYSNEVAEYPSFLDNATIIFSDISDIKTISVSGRNAHVIINNGNKPSVCHLNK